MLEVLPFFGARPCYALALKRTSCPAVMSGRCRLGVTIEVRRHVNAERGRGVGRKSWLLKSVIFTLATEPPTPALLYR